MHIVIDISEEDYKIMKHNIAVNNPLCPLDQAEMVSRVANGIPLPEGHGRLVDADKLLISERPKGIADDVWKESHIYKLLSNAPTIIEVDKEE